MSGTTGDPPAPLQLAGAALAASAHLSELLSRHDDATELIGQLQAARQQQQRNAAQMQAQLDAARSDLCEREQLLQGQREEARQLREELQVREAALQAAKREAEALRHQLGDTAGSASGGRADGHVQSDGLAAAAAGGGGMGLLHTPSRGLAAALGDMGTPPPSRPGPGLVSHVPHVDAPSPWVLGSSRGHHAMGADAEANGIGARGASPRSPLFGRTGAQGSPWAAIAATAVMAAAAQQQHAGHVAGGLVVGGSAVGGTAVVGGGGGGGGAAGGSVTVQLLELRVAVQAVEALAVELGAALRVQGGCRVGGGGAQGRRAVSRYGVEYAHGFMLMPKDGSGC